jgi:radical SAM protein with 4Fe4S-binding SPASM domain
MMGSSIWMAINITLHCNRDCGFCFNKKAGRSKTEMDWKTIEKLLSVFKKHIEKYGHSRHTEIEIIGGEPLIVPEKTKYLAEKFKEISPVAQVKISSNTHLLNRDWLNWFKEKDIVLCFSVNDNPIGLVHDKLELVKKHRVKIFPFIVLTPQNLNRLRILLAMFQGMQIFMIHEFGRTDESYINLFDEVVPQTLQWSLDENLRLNPERLYEAMSVYVPEGFQPHYGGLSFRVFIVETDGGIGKYFYHDIRVGNIWEDNFDFIESIGKNAESLSCMYGYKNVDICRICEYMMICGGGGGCQMRKIDTLLEDSPPSLCKTHKKVIPILLKMKESWANKPMSYTYKPWWD